MIEAQSRTVALPWVGITTPELDWCRAHPDVPEAAAVLALYGEKYASPLVRWEKDATLDAATAALRLVRPRNPVTIDTFFAYLNPSSTRGGEDIPGFGLDGKAVFMAGHDRARIQALSKYRPMIEQGLGMPMVLYRYERIHEIPREEIVQVYAPPGGLPEHERVDQIFALIIRFDSGDEGVGAYDHATHGQTPLIFSRRDAVQPLHRMIDAYHEARADVCFRVFGKRQRVQE